MHEYKATFSTEFSATESYFLATDSAGLEIAVYKGKRKSLLKIDSVRRNVYRFHTGDSTITVHVRDARSYANGRYRNAQNEFYNERFLGKKVLLANREANLVLTKMKRSLPVDLPSDSLYLRRHDYYCSFSCAVGNNSPVPANYSDLKQYDFVKPFQSQRNNYESAMYTYRDPRERPSSPYFCGWSMARDEADSTEDVFAYTFHDNGLQYSYFSCRENKKTRTRRNVQPLYYFRYEYF